MILERLRNYQKRQLEDGTVGILVVGTPGSGKFTLIRNLFDVEFRGKQGEIKSLSTEVDGVCITLHISYSIKEGSKHVKHLKHLLQHKLISLVIYCVPVNDTRLRPEPFEIIRRHSKEGVDFSRAVLVLTFSDGLVIPKEQREHPHFSVKSFFKQRQNEWIKRIKEKLVSDGVTSESAKDAIHMHSTTEDRMDLLPDGREWYGPLWEDIGRFFLIDV